MPRTCHELQQQRLLAEPHLPCTQDAPATPALQGDALQELDWSRLPAGLQTLHALLGPEAALALARAHGGATLYVPRSIKKEHPLHRLLGAKAAQALAAACGGDRLDVPKQDAALRQMRKKRILDARQQGQSIAALAARHNLSRRRILQILAD